MCHALRYDVAELTIRGTFMAETAARIMAELAALEDPRMRLANEKQGDDHGVVGMCHTIGNFQQSEVALTLLPQGMGLVLDR